MKGETAVSDVEISCKIYRFLYNCGVTFDYQNYFSKTVIAALSVHHITHKISDFQCLIEYMHFLLFTVTGCDKDKFIGPNKADPSFMDKC